MPFPFSTAADIVGAIRRDPNVSPAFAAALAPELTFAKATAYVEQYYARCDGAAREACVSVTGNKRVCRDVPAIQLTAHYPNGQGGLCVDHWDVWIEQGDAGPYLYGEC